MIDRQSLPRRVPTVAKIKSWNRLTTNRIAPGARLKILAAKSR